MSSQETSESEATFLDDWGHWVLWMGPYILIVSLLAWTPRLILLMVGIELWQFTWHARRNHPFHPLGTSNLFPLDEVVSLLSTLSIIAGIWLCSWLLWMLWLVGFQISLSFSVHRWIHRDRTGDVFRQGQPVVDIITFSIGSFVAVVMMIGDGDVPGFPLLRAFLL